MSLALRPRRQRPGSEVSDPCPNLTFVMWLRSIPNEHTPSKNPEGCELIRPGTPGHIPAAATVSSVSLLGSGRQRNKDVPGGEDFVGAGMHSNFSNCAPVLALETDTHLYLWW